MTIYRGFDVDGIKGAFFAKRDDTTIGPFLTEDAAMNAIDAHKRRERDNALTN